MPAGSASGFQCAVPATRRSEADSSPRCSRIARDLVREPLGRERDRAGADAGEARRVVARGDRPRRCRRVRLGEDVDVVRLDAEAIGDDLRGDRPVALALRRRRRAGR